MDEMVSLTKAQVPNYLVGSEFYNSLSADDDEAFSIPQKFLKPTVNVASGAELAHMFHTMKFWGVMSLPSHIIDLLIFKSVVLPVYEEDSIRIVLLEFDTEFKLSHLYDTLPVCSSKKQRLDTAEKCGRQDVLEHVIHVDGQVNAVVVKAAAEHGLFDLLQRVISMFPPDQEKSPFAKVSTASVASQGNSDCLRYVLENGCKKEKNTCRAAAENGHLACLKVAHEHGYAWNHSVAKGAAMHGHLDCLKYALKYRKSDKFSEIACAAAEGGQLKCLTFLLDQGVAPTKRMCYAACEHKHIGCLQLLRVRGAPWDVVCARKAANSGSLACQQFLLDNGCKTDASVTSSAAATGNDQCLMFLIAEGCEVECDSVDEATKRGHVSCAKVLREYCIPVCEEQMRRVLEGGAYDALTYIRTLWAAHYNIPQSALVLLVRLGKVECVEFICATHCCYLTARVMIAAAASPRCAAILNVLHQYGCPWNAETCARAASNQDLEGLSYAYEHGCPWDASTTTAAMQSYAFDCLEYALEHGCPVTDDACELAASRGQVSVLQILHRYGSALTLDTCVAAAAYKYPQCLTYAVKNGAPVDASICAAAMAADADIWYVPSLGSENKVTQRRMLQCAHELGCPWDERTITAAITCGNLSCVEYALRNGCPASEDACEHAASQGLTDIFYCLHQYGCDWNERTCAAAAKHPDGLNCLKYAHEHGCPWDASTTRAAARAGRLPALAYALQHGCPFDADICVVAAKRGRVSALKLLHEHGCPWDERVSKAAAVSGNASCLRYCVEHGCPFNKTIMVNYNHLLM